MELSRQEQKLIKDYIGSEDFAEATIRTYSAVLTRFYKWFNSNCKRRGLIPEHKNLIAFRNFLKGKNNKGKSVNLFITVLRKYFDWMILSGNMKNNPMNGIKLEHQDKEFMREKLNKKQSIELLSSFNIDDESQLRDYTMVVIMLTMGLRRIEVHRINIEDIEDSKLKIQGKGQNYKNDSLQLTHLASQAIEKYLSVRVKGKPGTALFISLSDRSKNKRISECYISKMVKNHYLTIGINDPKISCHSLRHTCAYDLLERTKDESIVQTQLRHKSIDTTHRYTHGLEKEINKNKALESLNKMWDERR